MDTQGMSINCKGAVLWSYNEPLVIEDIQVAPPKSNEIRVKVAAVGVCHTDYTLVKGLGSGFGPLPVVPGHEGAGIVESVGNGVKRFEPGDHVVMIPAPQCDNCEICLAPGNYCCVHGKEIRVPTRGNHFDGTKRFSSKGKELSCMFGVSSFIEYTVVHETMAQKVDPDIPFDELCLFGCCVPTGYFSAAHTGAVTKDSVCAVFGLGAVGLTAIMACRSNGAKRIIAIDINPAKFEVAKICGATDFINPKDYDDQPMADVIEKLIGSLCDVTIECVGLQETVKDAFLCSHSSYGVCVVNGALPAGKDINIPAFELLRGRTIKGAILGGKKTLDGLKELCDLYKAKQLNLDALITHRMTLEQVNEALDILEQGKSIRTVITLAAEQ
ncbi:all-trans-retinol dehydrogenase [NAD(+)] ADH1B-like isoform X2 [Tubulanus polymorphus]|uniref:all-trans-retinol dehydrogenase [NAD(+)] ADH1B-like isoform X2 n=1 Tax=Tubulanus polymorphus TaxID=672921 RepID=UPI003DA50262